MSESDFNKFILISNYLFLYTASTIQLNKHSPNAYYTENMLDTVWEPKMSSRSLHPGQCFSKCDHRDNLRGRDCKKLPVSGSYARLTTPEPVRVGWKPVFPTTVLNDYDEH